MKRISFNPRFVNEAGNDLISGKIHTIRQNYEYWKKFEGKELALFTWEGKPYRSGQKVFCVKRLVSVQCIFYCQGYFYKEKKNYIRINKKLLAANDGFENCQALMDWFKNGKYKLGQMAILHFTDFRY
jgi:hypothetical protein